MAPRAHPLRLGVLCDIVVTDYETVASFPKPLKGAIGREKFIMISVYSQIEKLWPAHLL